MSSLMQTLQRKLLPIFILWPTSIIMVYPGFRSLTCYSTFLSKKRRQLWQNLTQTRVMLNGCLRRLHLYQNVQLCYLQPLEDTFLLLLWTTTWLLILMVHSPCKGALLCHPTMSLTVSLMPPLIMDSPGTLHLILLCRLLTQ